MGHVPAGGHLIGGHAHTSDAKVGFVGEGVREDLLGGGVQAFAHFSVV